MQKHVIGIDVSKKTLDICAIFDGNTKKKSFTNTESGFENLATWMRKLELVDPHICMESTGSYSEGIAEFLHEHGFMASVVNPLQIKAFRASKMVRQKTDSSDCEVIAKFCLQNNPIPWQPKSRENKELHEINVRINALKAELNRLTNSLEKKILNKAVQESIHRQIESIKKDIKALGIEAKKIIEENDKLKRQFALLISIKGVGPKMALTILADMPDVDGFKTAKQFAAYVGVTPSHFQSGTSVNKKSHISRMGSKNIRKTLYMSSLVVKNHNKRFGNFVQKLEKKGKPPKVIIVAIMRKLMHIFFGMLKNNTTFNENLAFGD
jgi:transposase